jgi:hypothetical protein
MMHAVQRGTLPAITSLLSFALPAWVLVMDLDYIFRNIDTRIPKILEQSDMPVWVAVVLVLFFTMFFPVFFGMLLASFFPTIEIRRDGLNCSYWEFINCRVKWEEVESLAYYPNGYIVLRIEKRGLPILNGLYFYSLQARILRTRLPVVILSPGLEKRNELIEEILKKASPRIVQKE